MKTDNQIYLPDGRRLAYAEFGKPDGYPVLYFHGSPASRPEPMLIGDEAFSKFGLRVIGPDRPGMGQSDFQFQISTLYFLFPLYSSHAATHPRRR